jgi:hypothetical protein
MVSTISTSSASPSAHRKQTRHWSLMRMAHLPCPTPFQGFKSIAGRIA